GRRAFPVTGSRTDDHLRTEFQFPAVVTFIQRLVLEDAIDDPPFVVPALHDDPHPFAGHTALALELDLDVVAWFVVHRDRYITVCGPPGHFQDEPICQNRVNDERTEPSIEKETRSGDREIGKSYATLRPEQKRLVDDFG